MTPQDYREFVFESDLTMALVRGSLNMSEAERSAWLSALEADRESVALIFELLYGAGHA